MYNNAGKYLIVCNAVPGCDETEAVELFWQYRIGNVILIKYDNQHRATGYTFFHDESCGPGPPVKLEHWDDCIFENSVDDCENNMFPLKFKNLHRCPLKVSTFHQVPYMILGDTAPSGADGDLLNIIIEALNATLVLVIPRDTDGWGSLESNGTWSGSLGDVYYDCANFSMTSASITLHRYNFFQMSTNYNTMSVVWITHPSDVEWSSLKLLRPYSVKLRYALIVILLLIMLLGLFLKIDICKSIKNRLCLSQTSNDIILYSWQMCLSLPMHRLPTNWFHKYTILFWIWFTLLLRTFYQVYLINSLQTDVRTDNVLSIEDAIEEGYPYGGSLALKDYFIDQPDIYNNWILVDSNEIYPIMKNLSNGMKFVMAMNIETTNIFLAKSQANLYVLPQKIVNSPVVLFFKKYSWLVQSINTLLTNLFEAGLPDKLLEDYVSKGIRIEENDFKSITIEHFHGCFYVLFLGWTLSIVIAIIEKLVYLRRSIPIP
ncbi:glutamate receptor ionotropic, NMDA 2C-like [Colias croceus]|uniref:glutamate receptor ionotropic, NMDA 2C-like n=1 Tax=Colias crocea TaxID=72248 RepID=UPI001E279F8B|nr:glutamate receptor ionotropic, NMDA 2C-like [Colias croceus]